MKEGIIINGVIGFLVLIYIFSYGLKDNSEKTIIIEKNEQVLTFNLDKFERNK